MNPLPHFADRLRFPGDPSVIETGPSSRRPVDNAAKNLGWLSMVLGLTEVFGARSLTRALGIEGHETLVRTMGVREIAAGMTCLSSEEVTGMWSRVAGDVVDIAGLASIYRGSNPKRDNVALALAAVLGITLLDIATAAGLSKRHKRNGAFRDYGDRSGWPQGLGHSLEASSRPTTVEDAGRGTVH